MMAQSHVSRLLRLGLIALASIALSGCDAVAVLGDPTHEYVLQADMEHIDSIQHSGKDADAFVESALPVLERRLNAMGLATHSITHGGHGRVILQTSGENGRDIILAVASAPAIAEFRLVDDTADPADIRAGLNPVGSEIFPRKDGYGALAVKRRGGIDGDRVTSAQLSFDALTEEPVVVVSFDEPGTRALAKLTRDNVGRALAVIVDDEVIMSPVLAEPITGGSVQIAGGFTVESASQLAIMLRSGALPASFAIVEERQLK